MTVISVENLSKKYIISHQNRERYTTFRDVLANGFNYVFAKFQGTSRKKASGKMKEDFWALNEINFNVNQGDRIGIIGRNGAGKSTLLKILSRITEPTKGKVSIKGRVASLLEVGTGFHPELTGRENIYLNGAILGMSKKEITNKFDEIVDFAEIEKFLDTPVKRYSSGMYVRLAFSVAAHLESEILIIDEILAVGDADFQQKCMGKMEDISKKQRTILFVSHNMGSVERLCSKGLLIKKGEIAKFDHNVREVIAEHLGTRPDQQSHSGSWENSNSEFGNPYFLPKKMWISDSHGKLIKNTTPNDIDYFVNIDFISQQPRPDLEIGIRIYQEDSHSLLLVSQHTDTSIDSWPKIEKGRNLVQVKIPKNFLNEDNYLIELCCSLYNKEWVIKPLTHDISLRLSIRGGLSNSPYWYSKREGVVAPILEWTSN